MLAEVARVFEMSSMSGVMDRIKSMSAILFPLIFTSMDRIDVISNAMELRGFGKNRKRTWYSGKKLTGKDIAVIVAVLIFAVVSLLITFSDGSRFYNPFV